MNAFKFGWPILLTKPEEEQQNHQPFNNLGIYSLLLLDITCNTAHCTNHTGHFLGVLTLDTFGLVKTNSATCKWKLLWFESNINVKQTKDMNNKPKHSMLSQDATKKRTVWSASSWSRSSLGCVTDTANSVTNSVNIKQTMTKCIRWTNKPKCEQALISPLWCFYILFKASGSIHWKKITIHFKENMWLANYFKQYFLFVYHKMNWYRFRTARKFWIFIEVPHMTNSTLSFQLKFPFKWYHIEKMQHAYYARLVFWHRLAGIGVVGEVDWKGFSQWVHGKSYTLTSLGSRGDQALVLWKHMWERPFVEFKQVISYNQVVR